jgi:(2Fe-2S) ferredoxin
MPNTAVSQLILVGMGADAPTHHADLLTLAEHVDARLAYLQLESPTLVDVLDDISSETPHSTVRLLPLPVGGAPAPARSWLRRVAGEWIRRHPDTLTIEVVNGAVTGQEAGLTSPAWDALPQFQRHVLICRGPRCTAKGSADTAQAIADRLKRSGSGEDRILITQTGCLYPCNHGPVVAVYPDQDWWGPVSAADAEALVSSWTLPDRTDPDRQVRKPHSPRGLGS